MSTANLRSVVLTSLVLAGCGAGGLEYWLYPEPRLPTEEEAVFATYESNRLLFLDGEDVATKCWGQRQMANQGYHRNDIICRLHIRPGRHTVVFNTGLNNQQRATMEFDALSGKVYGLSRSGCTTSPTGNQGNCRFEVVEIESQSRGGRP